MFIIASNPEFVTFLVNVNVSFSFKILHNLLYLRPLITDNYHVSCSGRYLHILHPHLLHADEKLPEQGILLFLLLHHYFLEPCVSPIGTAPGTGA